MNLENLQSKTFYFAFCYLFITLSRSYMESTLVLSAGAVSAFLVYYSLVNESFIASLSRNGIVVRIILSII